MTPRSGHSKTAPAAVLHGSMFSKPCASAQGRVQCTRAAAQAAALRLLCHISKLALRVPLVFTKKHGIYAARLMLRLRLAFTNRTYYTMTLQSGLNKTAPAAVLHGSMFSKPCAPAQGRVQRTRAAAQTAALRLWLYHISKLTLRAPLVFTKKHGIYTAKFILRLRLAFAKRTYYTINMAAAKEFYRRKARRAHIFTLRPACALISGAAGTRCVRQCPRRCL